MASKTEICNLALSNIGISQFIADVDAPSEKSNEAIVCRRWYDMSLNFALEDFDWNFARRRLLLAEVSITPPTTWAKVYSYPSDCAAARAIEVPGVRTPYAEQRIPFEVAAESASTGDYKVIYTNLVAAVLVYTKRITDAGLFDAQFTIALSWLLAANIAMPLTVNAKLAAQATSNYQAAKLTAFARHLNESQEDPEPASETERSRNG